MALWLKATKGFTLIEALLVIGLIALLGTLAIPFYQTFQVQAQLDSATDEVRNVLRNSQLAALAGVNGEPHGVYFANSQFTVFTGAAFSPGDTANMNTSLPPNIRISTSFGQEMIFSGRYGLPSATGSITVSSPSATHILAINALGTIDQTQ